MEKKFNLEETKWKVDLNPPHFLCLKEQDAFTGQINWQAFKGLTDEEKQENAIRFAEFASQV